MDETRPPEHPAFSAPLFRLGGEEVSSTKLLAVLVVLAVFYTLYFARAVLLPIVLALLLALMLMPAVRRLQRLRLPRPLGAAVVVAILVACLGGLAGWIYDPAAQWIEKAPSTIAEMERKLRGLRKSVEEMARMAEKVQQLATPGTAIAAKPVPPPAPSPAQSLLQRTFSTTFTFLVTALTTLVLLYFLLATSDLLMRNMVRVMPTRADKKRVIEVAREIESRMATYFGTVTLINAGLGLATGFAMYWLGMPNPVLWGVMAFAFNYFPYLGAAVSLVVLTVVAALSFDHLRQVLMVPAVFFAFTILEGQFLAPLIVGRSLILNPIAILISMLFWAWLWGVVGALLAVPILVTFKIFCEYHERLKPIGELLVGRAPRPAPDRLAPG